MTHVLRPSELGELVNRTVTEAEAANRKLLEENVALSREVQAWRDAAGMSDPGLFAENKHRKGVVITRKHQESAAEWLRKLVRDFLSQGRVAQLDLTDIRPILEQHFPATRHNGHQVIPNGQELDVCTVCGAAEGELGARTCAEQLKKDLDESAHLFARDIKAWQEATGRIFPYEAKRDLETAGRQVLDWQEATGCADAATYKAMRSNFPGEWQRATGCDSPDAYSKSRETELQGWRHSRELAEGALTRIAGLLGVHLGSQPLRDYYDEIVMRVEVARNKAQIVPADHLEWQRATGCTEPEVIAERLATFRKLLDCGVAEGIPDGIERLRKQHTAQANNITKLQKQLYAFRRELREAGEQLTADRALWSNRWGVFKGHVHELGHWVGCEQREQEHVESFLQRCVAVAKAMVQQSRGERPDRSGPVVSLPEHTDMLCQFYTVCTEAGAGNELKHAEILGWLQERLRRLREPLRWQLAAPGSQLPAGYLQVIRRGASIQDVRLITIPKLTASFSNENWLLGPLPDLPAPKDEPKPELPDLLTLRNLEDDAWSIP